MVGSFKILSSLNGPGILPDKLSPKRQVLLVRYLVQVGSSFFTPILHGQIEIGHLTQASGMPKLSPEIWLLGGFWWAPHTIMLPGEFMPKSILDDGQLMATNNKDDIQDERDKPAISSRVNTNWLTTYYYTSMYKWPRCDDGWHFSIKANLELSPFLTLRGGQIILTRIICLGRRTFNHPLPTQTDQTIWSSSTLHLLDMYLYQYQPRLVWGWKWRF